MFSDEIFRFFYKNKNLRKESETTESLTSADIFLLFLSLIGYKFKFFGGNCRKSLDVASS